MAPILPVVTTDPNYHLFDEPNPHAIVNGIEFDFRENYGQYDQETAAAIEALSRQAAALAEQRMEEDVAATAGSLDEEDPCIVSDNDKEYDEIEENDQGEEHSLESSRAATTTSTYKGAKFRWGLEEKMALKLLKEHYRLPNARIAVIMNQVFAAKLARFDMPNDYLTAHRVDVQYRERDKIEKWMNEGKKLSNSLKHWVRLDEGREEYQVMKTDLEERIEHEIAAQRW